MPAMRCHGQRRRWVDDHRGNREKARWSRNWFTGVAQLSQAPRDQADGCAALAPHPLTHYDQGMEYDEVETLILRNRSLI